ncbi:hypothetical protein EJ03DRAFT_196102 [Teratosphaeria nubilosa]|uniref:Uncharacterized protein n=1 Tax=Teratosphaeria nubilosa TaxID=161662 RepID=A0A6G1L0M9_9PEZI|nr:hypothetical protein EJ03DRAFT_196102 [Teratosphaeria nubilosa]
MQRSNARGRQVLTKLSRSLQDICVAFSRKEETNFQQSHPRICSAVTYTYHNVLARNKRSSKQAGRAGIKRLSPRLNRRRNQHAYTTASNARNQSSCTVCNNYKTTAVGSCGRIATDFRDVIRQTCATHTHTHTHTYSLSLHTHPSNADAQKWQSKAKQSQAKPSRAERPTSYTADSVRQKHLRIC